MIAGEDSGDKLGSSVMDGLRETLDEIPQFCRYRWCRNGEARPYFNFPMSELSVMGIIEIVSHYKNLKKG